MNNEEQQINLPVDLPSDLLDKYREIDQEFQGGLYQSDPAKAFSLWNDLYKQVLDRQPQGRRYHKGGEVHNMGICKYFLGHPLDSLNYFMMGFIEDVLSTKTESGTPPEQAPGAQNLKNIFGLTDIDFQLIRKVVEETKKELGVVQDPQYVMNKLSTYNQKQNIESRAKRHTRFITPNAYSISRIPGDWEKRVFIGGDYGELYILDWIKKIVIENRYTPILAIEFQTPPELIHDYALLALHNCKHAIFDISSKGGHLMEIERIFDYRTNTLFVCQDSSASTITGMLKSLDRTTYMYKDYDELKIIVEKFLQGKLR